MVAVLLDNFTAAAADEKARVATEKSKLEGRTPQVFHLSLFLVSLRTPVKACLTIVSSKA